MSTWFADELRWTDDPKALIPGEPEKLYEDVDKLTTWSTTLEGMADDLGAVRAPGWNGKARLGAREGRGPRWTPPAFAWWAQQPTGRTSSQRGCTIPPCSAGPRIPITWLR